MRRIELKSAFYTLTIAAVGERATTVPLFLFYNNKNKNMMNTGVHEVDIIIVVEKIVGKGWLDGRRWLEI